MNSGLLWTPKAKLDVLPSIRDTPELLGTPLEERLHPRGEGIWHGQQGGTPHCAAYAWLHWYAVHMRSDEPALEPKDLYLAAREHSSSSAHGTTLVAAGIAMGFRLWRFARLTTAEEISLAVLASGPVVFASTWSTDMARKYMRPTGRELGAHGYLLDGYKQGRFRVKNSLSRHAQWLDEADLDRLEWEAWLALPRQPQP